MTKTQFKKLLPVGATIEDDGVAIYVYAPAGFVWADMSSDTLCIDYDPAWYSIPKTECWAELAERVAEGIEPQ